MKPGKTASGSVAIALYESYDFFALISAIVKFYEDEHMKELSIQELDAVSGGVSDDTIYAGSLASAGGFLFTAITSAAALTPVGMGILLTASIISSGIAIATAYEPE
jgi:bacteriocin-like protein|tara:strand:- start:920 stop:1240 length:321 start_codon:yes stop_codon:yes gene_type:complete